MFGNLFSNWFSSGNSSGNTSGTQTGIQSGTGGSSNGIFGDLLGGLNTIGQLYGAYKQLDYLNSALDLQQEQFDFTKEAWNKNYENQVSSYNTRIEDRQRARLSADPNAYQSLDTYMAENQLS